MIIDAIKRAYKTARERGWDSVYWAIDLHGVCFPSNYARGSYEFIHDGVIHGLRAISLRPESKIILWSSAHPNEHADIIDFFQLEHGIRICYFNENPEIKSTATGNFEKKFYFSVLLDDKAGFDPHTDWQLITDYLRNNPERL